MSQKKFWFLSRVRIFQDLSLEDAEHLETLFEVQRYRRKQAIYNLGDSGDKIFIIKSGLVKISKVTEEGKELTLNFLTVGDIFGELAVFDGSPRNALAEAYDDTIVCSMTSEDFMRFMLKHPMVGLNVTRLIAERRRKLENKIDNLLFKAAHARLAGLFMELASDFGVKDSRGTIINLKLTHREMANLIGSTRETVSFALIDLKKQGLIEADGKRVILLDMEALSQVYDGRSPSAAS
ncbi:MAG: Crp/Fnr family transcriptional regulator [Myxococcota bacterium]